MTTKFNRLGFVMPIADEHDTMAMALADVITEGATCALYGDISGTSKIQLGTVVMAHLLRQYDILNLRLIIKVEPTILEIFDLVQKKPYLEIMGTTIHKEHFVATHVMFRNWNEVFVAKDSKLL